MPSHTSLSLQRVNGNVSTFKYLGGGRRGRPCPVLLSGTCSFFALLQLSFLKKDTSLSLILCLGLDPGPHINIHTKTTQVPYEMAIVFAMTYI
jgi:hypothetical protein